MNYIPTNLKINIEWTVMKGVGNEAEDFSRSVVALFLFSEKNRWAVPCVADYTGVVKAQLPETLAEGVYSLDLIWVKNDGSVQGSRCVQRTRKPCVFAVDAGTQSPAGYEGQPVTVEIRTVAAPYGYDGLSAYEIAVLRGATILDEYEWSKGLFNDVLANELKRNQEEIAGAQGDIEILYRGTQDLPEIRENISKAQGDIEILYRGTQDLPEIRENISKAQGDIESGKKEVKSLRETIEGIAAGGAPSLASAVMFDNENTTLYGANVQEAVEELSSKVDTSLSNVIPSTNDEGACVLLLETFGSDEGPETMEYPMPEATPYNAGVMSKEDKSALNGLLAGTVSAGFALQAESAQKDDRGRIISNTYLTKDEAGEVTAYNEVNHTVNGKEYIVATPGNAKESFEIYAPVDGGNSTGLLLQSGGDGQAPTWVHPSAIKTGGAKDADNAEHADRATSDEEGNVITNTYVKKTELGDIGTTAQQAKQIAEKASQDVAAQESTIADLQETIENISAGGGATNAASVTYNCAGGSLTSTNVQNALTEVAGRLDDLDEANSEAVKNSEISDVRHIVNGVEYKTIVPSGETKNMDFVAPIEAGMQGYILQSSGDKSIPPTWADPTDFKVGNAGNADFANNANNASMLGGVGSSSYAKKSDAILATDESNGVRVTLKGTLESPEIELSVNGGAVVDGSSSIVNANDVYDHVRREIINQATFTAKNKGLVPASTTNTSAYLKGDGTWDTPKDATVSQTIQNTSNAEHPLLLAASGQNSTTTGGAFFDSQVTVNPNTNTITANKFKGTATEAEVATKAIQDVNGSEIAVSYIKKGTLAKVANSGSYNDLKDRPGVATQSVGGFMSATDKTTLDQSVAMVTPLTGDDGSCVLEVERNDGTYLEFPVPKVGSAKEADNALKLGGTPLSKIHEFVGCNDKLFGDTEGWYRIARSRDFTSNPKAFILFLERHWSEDSPESYVFSISNTMGDYFSITQLSGVASTRLIDKIRVVNSASVSDYVYVDIHINPLSGYQNRVYWGVVGDAVAYHSEEVVFNPELPGTHVEFETVNGFKTNLSIYEGSAALSEKYLLKSGGRMGVDATLTFGASKAIRQITALTHDAARFVEWYKGEEKDPNYEYAAQIGWYNMGDTDGAIFLIPHPTSHEPWSGLVGLYIGKNTIKWGNKPLIHSGNVGDYASLPGDAISAQSNNGGVKVQLGGTIGAPTLSVTTTTGGVSAANSGVVSGKEVKDYVDANAATKSVFSAATSSSVGSNGLVPAPSSANTMKFLRGDGTWQTPTITKDSVTSALGYTPAKEVPNTMVWGGILNTAAYATDYAVGTVLKVATSESLYILKDGSLITSSLASGTNVIVSHESYMSGSSYNSGKVFVIF